MNDTPASLLERLRQPEPADAWERFVKLYTPLLCHWAQRLGLRRNEADDLVQDVFAILVQKLPQFCYDPQQRFRAWLWTILRNKHRERRRQQAGTGPVSDALLAELAVADETEAMSEAEYRQYLVRRAVQLMQNEFQPTTWKSFWELVVNDRPGAEVAQELGLSLDAVYAAKSRVLRRLRQELDGLLG
jgi:RNA polymerase sigma-70 factor (ECF subfamily)